MTKLQTRKRNGMTTFNEWTLTQQHAKQLNINPLDTETSDAQREDGKMTSEDSHVIETDFMVYHDVDDDDPCIPGNSSHIVNVSLMFVG
jgi:hypothetical protein